MKARHGSTGNGNKQDGKQALPVDLKTDKGRHIDGRISNEDSDHRSPDHKQQQKNTQIVPRLH